MQRGESKAVSSLRKDLRASCHPQRGQPTSQPGTLISSAFLSLGFPVVTIITLPVSASSTPTSLVGGEAQGSGGGGSTARPWAGEAAALALGLCPGPLPGSQLQRQALHPHRALGWQQEEGWTFLLDCPPHPALGYAQAWEKATCSPAPSLGSSNSRGPWAWLPTPTPTPSDSGPRGQVTKMKGLAGSTQGSLSKGTQRWGRKGREPPCLAVRPPWGRRTGKPQSVHPSLCHSDQCTPPTLPGPWRGPCCLPLFVAPLSPQTCSGPTSLLSGPAHTPRETPGGQPPTPAGCVALAGVRGM